MFYDENALLIALASLIAFFAVSATFHIAERLTLARGGQRLLWLAAVGLCFGGGLWTAHVISLLAHTEALPASFSLLPAFLSLAIAVMITMIGFSFQILTEARSFPFLLIGGMIMGPGIVLMQSLGTYAFPLLQTAYEPVLIMLSLMAAITASMLMLWLADNAEKSWQQFCGALLMTAATGVMNSIFMKAMELGKAAILHDPTMGFAPTSLAMAIALGFAGILMMLLLLAVNGQGTVRKALAVSGEQLDQTIRQLKAARHDAEAARLAKANFMANMNHELRTPLNAIIGFAELLKEQPFGALGNMTYVGYANYIHAGGLRLLTLLNHILEMVRIQSGDVIIDDNLTDMAKLAETAAQKAREAVRTENIIFTCKANGQSRPIALCDQTLVRRAIGNLIDNAIKFSPPGEAIEVDVHMKDGRVVIAVRDHGIGMPKAVVDQILAPGGTAGNILPHHHQSAGLGIMLARLYMEMHGGWVEIDSEIDIGTTVYLHFPPGNREPVRHVA